MSNFQRIICIDFDGVIHAYTSGWKGPEVVADDPVPGAFEWLIQLLDHPDFRPVVYSSRSKTSVGVHAMREWFKAHGFIRVDELEFPTQKPAAFLTVDDRAFCFQGLFPTLQAMAEFRAWNKA